MIGARASPGCELCKRERQQRKELIDNIQAETEEHIQSAGCKVQKKRVIGAHNRCWKYLLGPISKHGEAKRDGEFIGADKDRQLESLWRETRIGDVLPWEDVVDESQRLLDIRKASRNAEASRYASNEDHEDGEQENDQEVDRDETDPYNEVTFGRRRPDSVVVDWTNKTLFVLEFKSTSDQRRDYRELGESRVRAQHDILIRSLEKVAGDAEGENGSWKIKLIIFVGGTSGSVNVQIFNDNLKELQVLESKRNAIRKGLVYELLNTQDTVLCSYFA
jgi:hypothetical protein